MALHRETTIIKYAHAENVSIAGTFTNWKPKLMNFNKDKSENYIELENKDLKNLIFKFVVHGDWKTSEKYPTTSDDSGNLNNYVDLKQNKEEKDGLLRRPSLESSISYKSLMGSSTEDEGSEAIAPDESPRTETTSHGTNNESLLKRIWVWLKAIFIALF